MTQFTHTGTGTSPWVEAALVTYILDFAGTATVDLEIEGENGGVVKLETGLTADSAKTVGEANGPTLKTRTNCTAHTNDVVVTWRAVAGPIAGR